MRLFDLPIAEPELSGLGSGLELATGFGHASVHAQLRALRAVRSHILVAYPPARDRAARRKSQTPGTSEQTGLAAGPGSHRRRHRPAVDPDVKPANPLMELWAGRFGGGPQPRPGPRDLIRAELTAPLQPSHRTPPLPAELIEAPCATRSLACGLWASSCQRSITLMASPTG